MQKNCDAKDKKKLIFSQVLKYKSFFSSETLMEQAKNEITEKLAFEQQNKSII